MHCQICVRVNREAQAPDKQRLAVAAKHLLEVGVFGVSNQLQQNGLGGGEVSSALLQTGQSKQTVRLAAEENTQVAIQLVQQLSAVHRSLGFLFQMKRKREN